MSQKCVHKGCEKSFTDAEEDCFYHPGPPIFHEGQKGWKCCKPRVLTFEEFLSIAPCTTGKHSTSESPPLPLESESAKTETESLVNTSPAPVKALEPGRPPLKAQPVPTPTASPAPPESESDDPTLPIPPNVSCRRKGCGTTSTGKGEVPLDKTSCVHHPGQPLFHEGSKGWTCCKRRVLEFDEFLKIQGCKEKARHLFGGRKSSGEEEKLSVVRHDFYQTPTLVIASLYVKKVDKKRALIEFSSAETIDLDLPTSDNKRYKARFPLFGQIDVKQSSYKIMTTKIELSLVKTDGSSWPTLRSDEQGTGEIIQTGRAGRA